MRPSGLVLMKLVEVGGEGVMVRIGRIRTELVVHLLFLFVDRFLGFAEATLTFGLVTLAVCDGGEISSKTCCRRLATRTSLTWCQREPGLPMDMEPLNNSAKPARMTYFGFPRLDSPAVKAKGTVRPSANPRIKSWT